MDCSFYTKIGACRHGDRCARRHPRPSHSNTVLLANMFVPLDGIPLPPTAGGPPVQPRPLKPQHSAEDVRHFDMFFHDVFCELAKYGELKRLIVCENEGLHLVGNVYAVFRNEADAVVAAESLNNRYYGGRPLFAELSPMIEFRDACCRQHDMDGCDRGGQCNFLHVRRPTVELENELYRAQDMTMR
ncbi:splicing factor U2AF subunit, partial [Ramicandelaber brevisporus]